MKTRQELEKMFDEKFWDLWSIDFNNDWNNNTYITDDVKLFIFETIIPEVLKSVTIEIDWNWSNDFSKSKVSWNYIIKDIKQKAKELYWIDL